jgi:hypothetical protein
MIGLRSLEKLVIVISVYLVALIVNKIDISQYFTPSSLNKTHIINFIVLSKYKSVGLNHSYEGL